MEKDKKVTALYCRLSKDDGSNSESLSIRTQKSMLMEYATRNGFGNCQYYVDDGYSGTNSDRPAFQELLDDIREGKVATVITKDQSRLGRNHIETGTYMEIFFPEHGVRYIAIITIVDCNIADTVFRKEDFLNTVSAILQSTMVMIPTSNLRWILPRSETSSMKCTPKTLPERSRVPFGHARKVESISPAAHRLATRKTLPTTITL